MKLLLVGPYGRDGQYSIPAFVATLERGLNAQGIHTQSCFPPETKFGSLVRPIVGKRTSFLDKFLFYPHRLKKIAKDFDCIHIAEHGYAPYVKVLRNKPHLITCHDLIVAKAARGELSDWPLSGPAKKYQESILQGLMKADHVAAVSEITRQDILRMARRSNDQTSLIYNGFYRQVAAMEIGAATKIAQDLGIPTSLPWMLHVGGSQPNKNKVGAVKIFGEMLGQEPTLEIGLVFAGAPPNEELKRAVSSLFNPSRVYFVDRPSDEQLIALYTLAKALLYPSLYEGFGLPIIEAQACGTPVFTSNRAPMTEAGGDAAIYIDPENSEEAAKKILLELPSIDERIPCGFKNIERFDSKTMCTAYLELYTRLVDSR